MTQRMVSGAPHEDDHNLDNGLRPRQLRDYIGQDAVKGLLDISIRLVNPFQIGLQGFLLMTLPLTIFNI